MDEIMIFNNPDFGEIRTVMIDGEPYFVGIEVAKALGYAVPKTAAAKHVDKEDMTSTQIRYSGQTREMTVINESGLYSLIFGSKLDSAKKFKKWVTKEVLPSIRKTGGYGHKQSTQEQITLLAQGTTELYSRMEGAESRIKDLEDTTTLDYGQQSVLGDTVNKTVMDALGGKESNAYKHIGRKAFAECNSDLKRYFKVNARANVPKKRFDEAVKYAKNWKPCTNTQMMIEQYNAQQSLNLKGGATV